MSQVSRRAFILSVGLVCAIVAFRRKRKREGASVPPESESKGEAVCPLSKAQAEDEVFEWVMRGEEDRLWEWVDAEPSRINHKEKRNKMTLLHASVLFDQPDIAAALLERGAEVDALESSALTPLHLACNEGYTDCVEVLLSHGASLFSINADSSVKLGGSIPIYSSGGQTPLHFAAAAGSMACLDLLLASPNAQSLISRADFDGNTPADLALLKGHSEVALRLEPSRLPLSPEQRTAKLQQDYVVRAGRITSREGSMEALLRAGIRDKFIPRHPQLFDTSLDRANFAGNFLATFDHLEEQKGFGKEIAQGIYAFDLMTPAYCQQWIEEIENYEAQALQKGLPVRRPNSMNNYGLVLNDIGFAPVVEALRSQFLQPIMQHLYPSLASLVSNHHTFAVKYKLGEDLDLGTHVDNSLITVNLSLGKSFKGGTLYFHGVVDQANAEPQPFKDSHDGRCGHCELVYDHKPGVAVIHVGKHIHGANRLIDGERVNLIIWFQP